ncbi:LOW QUALITY PROTEIN: uncharacterized protein [Gorilla gorilla gorilla]|uniref:LOW QUALITY PROTEIN: uncharacterized protein n=1 Tax=Gorilla gorilla gorilla TaxID=9595 RepID=UPI003009FC8D
MAVCLWVSLLSVGVSVCGCLSPSMAISLCLWVSLPSVGVHLCLWVSLSVSVSLWLSLLVCGCLCLWVSLCECLSLWVSPRLWVSLLICGYLSLSVGISVGFPSCGSCRSVMLQTFRPQPASLQTAMAWGSRHALQGQMVVIAEILDPHVGEVPVEMSLGKLLPAASGPERLPGLHDVKVGHILICQLRVLGRWTFFLATMTPSLKRSS